MPSTSETGHAKNVANFQDLIAFVVGFGTAYNPSKAALKLTNLQARLLTEQNNLAAVITKNTEYNNVVNERIIEYADLRQLCTRVVGALAVTDASKEKIADAKGFNKKIQSQKKKIEIPQADANTPAPKTISTSQQSYDQLVQHFNGLISVAQTEATYLPNENELKLTTLLAKSNALLAKNGLVATKYTEVSNARISRDKGLYNEKTGLVVLAAEVKEYVKSVFGYNSPQYKQVSKIKFTTVR
jgi:hypothetical protein